MSPDTPDKDKFNDYDVKLSKSTAMFDDDQHPDWRASVLDLKTYPLRSVGS